MKNNYQTVLDKEIKKISESGERPKLLIHSCCAPCSSYVLEYLNDYFDITVFYYNPNIYPKEEFSRRALEQKNLIEKMGLSVNVIVGDFEDDLYYREVRGLESEPEGGARCRVCFRLRFEKTAALAAKLGFDYFTTTLTISPLKDAEIINTLGEEIAKKYSVRFLNSDFKKREGYKRSVELSKKYALYRQNYCGCIFSKTKE